MFQATCVLLVTTFLLLFILIESPKMEVRKEAMSGFRSDKVVRSAMDDHSYRSRKAKGMTRRGRRILATEFEHWTFFLRFPHFSLQSLFIMRLTPLANAAAFPAIYPMPCGTRTDGPVIWWPNHSASQNTQYRAGQEHWKKVAQIRQKSHKLAGKLLPIPVHRRTTVAAAAATFTCSFRLPRPFQPF